MFDLEMFGVYDKGVPNLERIVLRVNNTVDLTNYAMIVGFKGTDKSLYPAQDFFLWLGNTTVVGPAWVFIYTGTGKPTVTREKITGHPIHSIYWNRPNLIFSDPNVSPALVRLGETQIYSGENKRIDTPTVPPAIDWSKIDWIKILDDLAKLTPPPKK